MPRDPKSQPPTFLIVIPVTHSIENLKLCLRSISRLDYPPDRFQVALVDCRVIEGLQAFRAICPSYAFPVSWICLPEKRLNLPAWLKESRVNEARNRAVQDIEARYYVFTEDDCAFEPDWLSKMEAALEDGVGIVGGDDRLPEGMDWFTLALDYMLNSFFGRIGARRKRGDRAEWYYPHKENQVIPARVLDRLGLFAEDNIFSAEMEMADRIKKAGYRVVFLTNNPVWHRRQTTLANLVFRNIHTAWERTVMLKRLGRFFSSPHFLLLGAAATVATLGGLSVIAGPARLLFGLLTGSYLAALFSVGIFAAARSRSLKVGAGVIGLAPIHHATVLLGVIKGVLLGRSPESIHAPQR